MADIDSFDNGMTPEEMEALEENRQPANPEPQIVEEKKDDEDPANPVQGEEKDTPTATPTEEKTDVQETGSDPEKSPKAETPDENPDDPKLPWHKHPRWIAREQKLKALEREVEELKANQGSSDPTSKSRTERGDQDDQVLQIPNWFQELYGSDDPEKDQQVYRDYLAAEEARENERVERVKQSIVADQTKQAEQERANLEWVDEQIASVRESLVDGDPDFTDNELLKVVKDYQPMKEEDGELVPDFGKAYSILRALKGAAPAATPPAPKPTQATNQKKALAAHTPSAVGEPEAGTIASNESLALDPPW